MWAFGKMDTKRRPALDNKKRKKLIRENRDNIKKKTGGECRGAGKGKNAQSIQDV